MAKEIRSWFLTHEKASKTQDLSASAQHSFQSGINEWGFDDACFPYIGCLPDRH